MATLGDSRGILYPTKLPTFHREPADATLEGRIRWFWVPRWQLAPGRTVRQEVLPFPASNLVVEPDGVSLVGPSTGASYRDLRGSGWAVGALLRPAGLASFRVDPQTIQDLEVHIDAPDLHVAVMSAMGEGDHEVGRQRAIAAFSEWAAEHIAPDDESGRLANAMEDLIASDRTVVRIGDIAEHLGTSIRGVQRLAQRYVGLPPLAIIRRYRLQEAAQRLREDRTMTIAHVAADLGYADHAHLSADFRNVLGFTPNSYRQDPDSP
ncbi:helix-turn-helix domain-containing protein [Rhodococcus sp. IEGM 1379]|uniref:AraC family transcriptional regulator n=1 Tax=Rhodococcus sp. IEGM 1379 TaxID=3047086 RepID=UPI0024B7641B|nr:helix-turn-helix domain-containing protein [Rhodococcus sp. IEGM 1379]MDI9914412.1 helix-turn-helix domain-containing protein [Rhodococcus sp. IEGM 1379]